MFKYLVNVSFVITGRSERWTWNVRQRSVTGDLEYISYSKMHSVFSETVN